MDHTSYRKHTTVTPLFLSPVKVLLVSALIPTLAMEDDHSPGQAIMIAISKRV